MSWTSKERIKVGDKVNVVYVGDLIFNAIVIRTPAGPGDLWQIKEENGVVRAINPYGPEFCEFIKHVAYEEENDCAP